MKNIELMRKIAGPKMLRAALVLLCGAGLAVCAAQAQDQAPPAAPQGQGQGPRGGRGGAMQDPAKHAKMLQDRLGLSDDQTAKVQAVFEGDKAKMEAARSGGDGASPGGRRGEMKAMREETEAKLAAIFTPDQKTKYDAMQAEMREKMKGQRQGGEGGNAPPPPSAPSAPQQ